MKKILLLILSVVSLNAMEETIEEGKKESYSEEQCLFELRQMEVALKLLESIEKRDVFKGLCLDCGGYVRNATNFYNKCMDCGKVKKDDDLSWWIRKNAIRTVARNKRALEYKK